MDLTLDILNNFKFKDIQELKNRYWKYKRSYFVNYYKDDKDLNLKIVNIKIFS